MKIKNFIWIFSVLTILFGATFTSCEETETEPEGTAVTSVTISRDSVNLDIAGTATLTATVKPSYATDTKVVWSTDDSSVATVSTSGVVTGVAEGQTLVVATSESNPEISGSCVVTVVDGGVETEITGGGDPTTYGTLKSYVNRAKSPAFKLGAAVNSSTYNSGGTFASTMNENYDELVSTYHMKHASIVSNTGTLDFTTADAFVSNASSAGLSVFGHALCWHDGNNVTYLDGLINSYSAAPKRTVSKVNRYYADGEWVDYSIDGSCDAGDPQGTWTLYSSLGAVSYLTEGTNNYISLETSAAGSAASNSQLILLFGEGETPATLGDTYRASFKVRSSNGETLGKIILQAWEYNYICDISPWTIPTTTSWTEVSFEIPITSAAQATAYRVAVSFGLQAAGTYDFDDISLCKLTTTTGGEDPDPDPEEETWGELITNGDFEGDTSDNFYTVGTATGKIDGESGNPGRSYKVTNATEGSGAWAAQFKIDLQDDAGMAEGDKYIVSFDARSSVDGVQVKFGTQTAEGSDVKAGIETFTFSEEYQTFEITIDNSTGLYTTTSVFAMNFGTYITDLYFDNVSVLSNAGGTTVDPEPDPDPEPEEESEYYDVAYGALEEFIKGMVEQYKGKIYAWDVVNEPLDDTNVSNLKTDAGATGNSYFYWQDYLGSNYAREAISLSRQYGGSDLILFVNEYGLQWTHVDKCQSLINWINQWESDGVTTVDGIGTQMHIAYYANAATQSSQEDGIVAMLELMAATGKYVKISELDIQYKNTSGSAVMAADMTDEMQLELAKFYEFIVTKYFEIVPAAQQYSITHWTPIDPSTSMSWRGGEPVGLWTEGYERKQSYAGFAEGLDSNL